VSKVKVVVVAVVVVAVGAVVANAMLMAHQCRSTLRNQVSLESLLAVRVKSPQKVM
jgi:hypothetical protein